jgi:hypothetical protein
MAASEVSAVDSRYAAFRLAIALLVMTVGAAGMYVVPVVLPSIQADFGLREPMHRLRMHS